MNSNLMSVTSLNSKIKSLLETTFLNISVQGEVASATYHSSGHLYFTIKDNNSSIKCVMWRSNVGRLSFQLNKGLNIIIDGTLGVYTPRGEYQLYTNHIEPYGKGSLALAYEQLKEKLLKKGYFKEEYKKAIPKNISKLALVTSKDSAGRFDMQKIIERRWPLVEVYIIDTLVQGSSASKEISYALKYADSLNVDTIILARGGGSSEDLWSFNEEIVVDTIFHLKTPIVSAIGHEIDFLLSDFVADLRAPTPSASIEMILPDIKEILFSLNEKEDRFNYLIKEKILKRKEVLNNFNSLFKQSSPKNKLEEKRQKLANFKENYKRALRQKIYILKSSINLDKDFKEKLIFNINQKKLYIKNLEEKFNYYHPHKDLKKGWGKVSKDKKVVLLEELKENEEFIIEDKNRKIKALVLEIKILN